MDNFGRFSGNPIAEWLTNPAGEDRDMRLLADFWYEEPGGQRWLAPNGSVVNGASIPRPFWTLIGSPFTGKYRRASIVHDVACGAQTQPHRAVHRMFYFACRADGLDDLTAKTMYVAIRQFGPKWRTLAEVDAGLPAPAAIGAPPLDEQAAQAKLEAIRRDLTAEGATPSIDELEQTLDRRFGEGA
jgi:hypothetical protein